MDGHERDIVDHADVVETPSARRFPLQIGWTRKVRLHNHRANGAREIGQHLVGKPITGHERHAQILLRHVRAVRRDESTAAGDQIAQLPRLDANSRARDL